MPSRLTRGSSRSPFGCRAGSHGALSWVSLWIGSALEDQVSSRCYLATMAKSVTLRRHCQVANPDPNPDPDPKPRPHSIIWEQMWPHSANTPISLLRSYTLHVVTHAPRNLITQAISPYHAYPVPRSSFLAADERHWRTDPIRRIQGAGTSRLLCAFFRLPHQSTLLGTAYTRKA